MLKTHVGDEIWAVHQPDHARVSGYLAAHWGGANGFAAPGRFAPFGRHEALRQEVVLAVAEHDNGWWEWEAAPPIDPADGLPLNLPDVGTHDPADGLRRWRLGVPRLADAHPYAALLISLHAHALYAFAFGGEFGLDDALRHPLFGGPDTASKLVADRDLTRHFLAEQEGVRHNLTARLRGDPAWAGAVGAAHLLPHLRLLQVLDALSLLLAFGGRQERGLANVPRGGWGDRVALAWRPAAGGRVVCDPYPFDADPLEVPLPVRILPGVAAPGEALPLTRLHAAPVRTVRFELTSRGA